MEYLILAAIFVAALICFPLVGSMLMPVVCIVIFAPIFAYRRIRRLGYFPIAATMLVLIVLLASLLTLIGTILLLPRTNSFWQILGEILICVGATIAFVLFGCAALVRKLPKRELRMFGRRRARFPFVSLGFLIIAAGIVLTVAAAPRMISFPESTSADLWTIAAQLVQFIIGDSAMIAVLILYIGGGLAAIMTGLRVRKQETIEGLTKSDARLPVLFVRPFAAENLPFVRGPGFEYGAYTRGAQRWAATDEITIEISFEHYLTAAFQERIGPFVALGNPEDYLPAEGAVRTYSDDEGWYEYFERLARRAACLVMPVSNSDNLQRELMFIRRERLQTRLFILTDLLELPRGFYSWLFKPFPWIFLRLYGPPRIDEKATWEDVTQSLGRFGFDLGDDPGRGAVVTFDAEGKAKVLVRGAKTPSQFVEPIREHLVSTLGLHFGEVPPSAEGQQVVALASENSAPRPG